MSGKVAISDLHSRLDFLIAYSSQLVFVANDDLQFQQSTLQSFIAQQHENIEVAFLKGEPNRSEEDYRKEICRQILHNTTGQFDGSLRTVLHDFDAVENPVLICLYAAQQIPHKLLRELWELVLLARSLNKNLHVNVVLFGDSKWVIDAKNRLPTNSGNKPVILGTELDGITPKQIDDLEQSELDALIANKRAAFAERVQARSSVNSPNENKPSLIQTRRFQIVVGLLFLATFATLVFWFYPQQTKQTTLPQPEASALINPEINAQVDAPVATDAPLLDDGNPVTIEGVESDESLLEPSDEPLVEELLVSQWQNPEVEEPEVAEPDLTEPKVAQAQIDSDSAELPSVDEQLASDQIELFATDEPSIATELRGLDKLVPTVHPLEEIEPGQFLLQISSSGNMQALERFILNNALQETSWIYSTTRFGGPWHVVIYKRLFQSSNEARNYITTLSGQLKNSSPFVKSIEKIQEEIAIAN